MRVPPSNHGSESGIGRRFRHVITAVSVAVLVAGSALPTAIADQSTTPSPSVLTSTTMNPTVTPSAT